VATAWGERGLDVQAFAVRLRATRREDILGHVNPGRFREQ
jgi:hypothetical protein